MLLSTYNDLFNLAAISFSFSVYDVINGDSEGLRDFIEFSLRNLIVVEIGKSSSRAVIYTHFADSISLNIEDQRPLLDFNAFEKLAVTKASEVFEIELISEKFDLFVVYED